MTAQHRSIGRRSGGNRRLGLALAVFVGLAGPAAAGDAVTIWSTRHQVLDRVLLDGFTKESGIAAELVDGEFDKLGDKIDHRTKDNRPDLVLTVGAVQIEQIAQKNVLQVISDPAVLTPIPAGLRDKAGRWIGLAYWARVICYRTDKWQGSDLDSYESLADPRFHGEVLVRSASSPYNRALVASVIAADGLEEAETWARGLVGNFARPPQGGDSDQLQALSNGEGSVAIVNTRFWGRLAGSPKVTEREVLSGLAVAFPNQGDRGTQIDVIAAGMMRDAPHPAPALALLRYLLRPEVQARFAAANFEYPIRPDVPPPPTLAALGPFHPDSLALPKLGPFNPDAEQVMQRAGWE